jgi:hypothetical protein
MKISSISGNTIFTKVSNLISPITGYWDKELLRGIFNLANVGRILQIPQNNQCCEHIVAWNVTTNGWKERNRRIFQGVRKTYMEVAHIAHEDIR